MKALIFLFVTGVFALFAGVYKKRSLVQPIAILGVAASLFTVALDRMETPFSFQGMMTFDAFALSFSGVVLVSGLLLMLLAKDAFAALTDTLGDHYGLMLFSLSGAIAMFSFDHLVMLFLGIEILSIALYVLAGSRVTNLKSSEAALKYYLMGSFATGILLFGTALVYGATGHFDLAGIKMAIETKALHSSMMLHTGILLVLFGLSFKVSAAPFHFWSPDVYEGSPTIITVFMATVVKTAGFAALFKLFLLGFGSLSAYWSVTVAGISALTMTVGNITAVFQKGFKRMMAYSSISHAGYLMLGLLSGPTGSQSLLLYLLAYSVATISAFTVFMKVEDEDEQGLFKQFAGLGKTKPLAALVMGLSMISLAGIPITAGFFGKYFLFVGAFAAWPWLIGIAILNSAISIYYYFRVIIMMYFTEADHHATDVQFSPMYQLVLVLGAALILILAFIPEQVLALVR